MVGAADVFAPAAPPRTAFGGRLRVKRLSQHFFSFVLERDARVTTVGGCSRAKEKKMKTHENT